MRRILCFILIVMMMCIPIATIYAAEATAPSIALLASSGVLIDAATGQVLMNHNADAPANAATAIKIMTLLVISEAIDSGRIQSGAKIQVSERAANIGGTSAFLDRGASYDAEVLLRAVCVCSANDASIALAEAAYGSESVFVEQMNARAKELGAGNSYFASCTGQEAESSTTAYDLALMAAELVKHTKLLSYTSIFTDEITHNDGRKTALTNANRLVRFYDGCDGLATGSSTTAGYCGIITAKRGETRLVCVVLGAKNSNERFADAQAMLEYGFANFVQRTIAKKGELLRKNVEVADGTPKMVNLVAAEDVRVVVPRGEENNIRKEIELLEEIAAPVEQGAVLGRLNVYLGEELIASTDAVAESQVRRASLWEALLTILHYWLNG